MGDSFQNAPDKPAIYGIVDRRDDRVVYVGRTRSLRRRIQRYANPRHCHNPALAEWLRGRGDFAGYVVLESGTDDPEKERHWIETLQGQLFNMVHGGAQTWRHHDRTPWMAHTGIKCPSALAYHRLKRVQSPLANNRRAQEARRRLESMSDADRCRAECAIAEEIKHNLPGLTPDIDKWMSQTFDRMVAAVSTEAG